MVEEDFWGITSPTSFVLSVMKIFPVSLATRRGPAAVVKLLHGISVVIALITLAAPLLACSSLGINGLRSQVKIEVGKQFELGGTQLLGFRVEAHNVGPVAVEIKEVTQTGCVTSFGLLQPGQQTKAAFGMGSKAILVNLGPREAKIDVNISNGAGLGMGYAAAQPSTTPTAASFLGGSDPTSEEEAVKVQLSRLLIPAGQEFLLGGGQSGGFTFVGVNVGAVAVQARERTPTGQMLERGIVMPGQAVKLQFGVGSQALLFNNSGTRARLKIDASLLNPRELGMTYRRGNK